MTNGQVVIARGGPVEGDRIDAVHINDVAVALQQRCATGQNEGRCQWIPKFQQYPVDNGVAAGSGKHRGCVVSVPL